MEIKHCYYDGSGHGYFIFHSDSLKSQSLINGETKKSISGNPYLLDWKQVRQMCEEMNIKKEV